MATVQERPVKTAPVAKHDAAVEAKLAQARRRLRLFDMSVALLGFLAGTLVFALALTLCDRAYVLSATVRQLAFAGYLLGSLAYLGFFVVWPMLRRINPYYTARQIEQTIPGAKNSVVNWLDLHDENLPTSIHGAVSQRAAKDINRADLEQAVSGRRLAWVGGIAGALVLAFIVVLLIVGAPQFFSLLGRAFFPFSTGGITARTRLTLLRPEGGDWTVQSGRSVSFAVNVEGKVPNPKNSDALKLLYRYRQTDPYEVQLLDLENGREWGTILAASQVNNGFWYKITGGDAETPEYQVTLRTAPLIKTYEVSYHYRPYLHWRDDQRSDPNLKDLRGTEVTLLARTNRTIKEGRLEFENAKKTIPAQLVPNDPHAVRFHFILEEDDRYRIFFISNENEGNDPAVHTITVIPDYPPQVKITRPEEEEIKLPANDLLEVEGDASDDIGVKSLTLRMRVVDGPELKAKVYREGKSFELSDGGYPKTLDYQDSVELAQLKDKDGNAVALKPGMVIEYWLEAADAYDHPAPHLTESKPHKRVLIVEPEKNQQKQQEKRKQAEQKKKEHEAKQDEKLKKEDEQRQRDAKANNQQNQNQQPDPAQQKKDEQTQNDASKVKDELNKNQQQEGQAKEDSPQEKSAAKNGGKPDPANEQKPGEGKKDGQPDPKQQPGEAKKGNESGQPQQEQSQAKGGGQGNGSEQKPGEAKPEQQQTAKSEAKKPDKSNGGAQEQSGSAKDGGQQQGGGSAQGQQKSAPPEKADGSDTARADSKGADKRNGEAQARNAKPEDVEKLANDLQNGDANQKRDAAQKLDQISRNAGNEQARDAAKQALDKADRQPGKNATPEDVAQNARDMKSDDPIRQKEGADKLDQMARNAKDEKTREAARQAIEKNEKRPGENAKPGDVNQQAKDLQGGDEKKQQQASEKLDQMARNAKDERVRDAARKELDKAKQQPGQNAKPEDVAQQEKQLQQGDAQQKRDAADKLEQMSRNAKDDKTRDAARNALEQHEQRPQENARPEDVAKQAKDLQSGDEKKETQAADKLEQMARNAKDERVKEAARKALEQAKKLPGQDAKPEDVAQQKKELEQPDPKKQRDAADKLEQMARNAKDEKTRDQASKALEEALKKMEQEQRPAEARQPNPQRPPENTATAKKAPPKDEEVAKGRDVDPNQPKKEQGEEKTADPNQVDPQARERGKTTDDHPLGPWHPGTGDGRRKEPFLNAPEPGAGPGDPRHRDRGGNLQLEDLKKIDNKIRDNLGWDNERLQSFRKAYEDLLKRKPNDPRMADADKPFGPQRGGNLNNTGATQMKPITGNPVDARYIGRGQPPPGYQDSLQEFRRRISDPDAVPEKK